MIERLKEIESIYVSERRFWQLISKECQRGPQLVYEPRDGLDLREAKKIVADSVDDLRKELLSNKPSILRFSPKCAKTGGGGAELARVSVGKLLEIFRGIVYQSYSEASLYLWADNRDPELARHRDSRGIEVRKVETESDWERMVGLRSKKDAAIASASVRASLATWMQRRKESIPEFSSLLVEEYGNPVGSLSFYLEIDGEVPFTRLRDLFVLQSHRGRGIPKSLFKKLNDFATPPFAVVTDTNNPALFQYVRRGFQPVFAQDAFQLLQFDRNDE